MADEGTLTQTLAHALVLGVRSSQIYTFFVERAMAAARSCEIDNPIPPCHFSPNQKVAENIKENLKIKNEKGFTHDEDIQLA